MIANTLVPIHIRADERYSSAAVQTLIGIAKPECWWNAQ